MYYTYYDLEMTPADASSALPSEKEICDALTEIDPVLFPCSHRLRETFFDEMNWENYECDMTEISKKYPSVHFELYGRGEAFDDFWCQHFINGKTLLCHGRITYDEFNPELMTDGETREEE